LSLVLDTSAVLALLNRSEPHHVAVKGVLLAAPGDLIIPTGILAEIGYLVENRLSHAVFDLFLEDILDGNFTLDCGNNDITRIRHLSARYSNLPLGYADAAVIACAERLTTGIVSLDKRHFEVVQRELGFELLS
jgi:uncharacterized protein